VQSKPHNHSGLHTNCLLLLLLLFLLRLLLLR
jgi:hypothetical protein